MVILRRERWLAMGAILIFFFLALDSLVGDSPTMDEQNHLARGLAYLRTRDPRLNVEHPPLVNAMSALPLLTMPEIQLPLGEESWQRQPPDVFWYVFAERMLWDLNRELDIQKIFFLARLPIVYLSIALGVVAWRFAGALWGRGPALLALSLVLFDPNILAHGRYVTTDLGGTLFAFLATYLLWRLWQARGWEWRRWLWVVLGLGLAFGSKLSTLVFVPIWVVLTLLPLYPARGGQAVARRVGQLLAAGLVATGVLWGVYAFQWGPFLFLDPRLAPLNAGHGPMPTFWSGLERILLLSQGGRPAYLLGQFSSDGFLLYFPVAWVTKTPLPVLILAAVAAVVLVGARPTRSRALFVLLPAALYFMATMASALNLGYRHLLPVLPFTYLLIAGLAGPPWRAWSKRSAPQTKGWAGILRYLWLAPALLVALLLLIDLAIHPHYLSYFNLAAGGPARGPEILLDSNVDWGQDLLRLRHWMVDHDVERVNLGWFGTADPRYYGLEYEPLPGFPRPEFLSQWTEPPFNTAAPEAGIYAISASNLWELQLADKHVYTWFRAREPSDRVGYSILIYEVP